METALFWYLDEILLVVARLGMIVQGLKDETFGIPIVALVLHISWDFWFSFYTTNVYTMDQVALLLDLAIMFQVLVFGHEEFFGGQRLPLYGLLSVCLTLSLGLTKAVIDEEGAPWSHSQLWYGYMFVTSVLFIPMLLSRGNARGQNMVVAVSRCACQLCAWIYQHPAVVGWLCAGSLIADVVYIYLLYLCIHQPQEFHEWRNYLLSNQQNAALIPQNENPQINKGVIYRSPLMTPAVISNNNSVEMAGGMPS